LNFIQKGKNCALFEFSPPTAPRVRRLDSILVNFQQTNYFVKICSEHQIEFFKSVTLSFLIENVRRNKKMLLKIKLKKCILPLKLIKKKMLIYSNFIFNVMPNLYFFLLYNELLLVLRQYARRLLNTVLSSSAVNGGFCSIKLKFSFQKSCINFWNFSLHT
jgi:hypothetical protein